MITKKVYLQKIPAVFNDKTEFNTSNDNFAVSSSFKVNYSPTNQIKHTKMDLKPVNYFGSKLNSYNSNDSNLNNTSNTKLNSNSNGNLNTSSNFSELLSGNQTKINNYYNFKSDSLNSYNTSFLVNNNNNNLNHDTTEKYANKNSYSLNNQESFIIPKDKTQTFQKYAIERHMNHFKPTSKVMIAKMLNGDIEESASTNNLTSTTKTNLDQFISNSGPIKTNQQEPVKNVSFVCL